MLAACILETNLFPIFFRAMTEMETGRCGLRDRSRKNINGKADIRIWEKKRAFARLFYVSYQEKSNKCYSITIIGLIVFPVLESSNA